MKLPALSRPNASDLIRDADDMAKARMKLCADNRYHAKPSTFAKGVAVQARQRKLNKLTPTYNPKPYRITHKKGSMITAQIMLLPGIRLISREYPVKLQTTTIRMKLNTERVLMSRCLDDNLSYGVTV